MVRRLKEDNNKSNLFDLRDYFSYIYKKERPPKELIQAYKDFLGPKRSYEYEQERIGENKLGYNDCYCCKCGEYLDTNNCPSGWYTYVSELGDDEGHAWRDFCDACWDEVSHMSADEILDTFEPAPYGEYLGQNYKTELPTNESCSKPMKESYSDINNDNVWEVFDYVKELLTPDGLVENMARWMGLDDLTKCMQYICRTQDINVLEDEEDE